ncbi:hypothetical protein I3760_14G025100 [Carya illinoinensis]|nr:hypothetical protein I3760_14G025100 [Carya illinoinensis]
MCFSWLFPYSTCFQMLGPSQSRLYLSRHVTFDENLFPFKRAPSLAPVVASRPCTVGPSSSSPDLVPPVRILSTNDSTVTPAAIDASTASNLSPSPSMTSSPSTSNSSCSKSPLPIVPTPPLRIDPLVTRA